LKIAYVITRSDVMGGASVHLLDLAVGVRELGHDVVIYVGGNGIFNERAVLKGLNCVSLKNLVRKIQLVKDICCFFELRSHLKRQQPDIVHMHSSKAGIIGRLAASSLRIPSIFTAHGWAFTEGVSARRRKIYLAIERFMVRFSNKIITVSEYDRELALNSGVGTSELILTIHNGIPDILKNVDNDLCSSLPRFIMVARFEDPKDQTQLIEAFSRINNKLWILELIGDGPSLGAVRAYVETLNISKQVIFSGACNDVSERLRKSDVFCLISNWEGLPLTILEAMRAGLPVIASGVGGVSEAVINGETGYVVPKRDVVTLSEAINDLLLSKKNRLSLGSKGRTYYESNFLFETMLDKTLKVYQQVLECNP
jgi:glycosyltransferase involved in cell wall biosynthesis